MMPANFLAFTAAALLIVSPAFAATSRTSAHHSATTKHASITMTKMTTASSRTDHSRMAKKVSMRGDSQVRALNALKSHGYRQFTDLHAKGGDFVATARKNGKLYDVTVLPSGQIRATSA